MSTLSLRLPTSLHRRLGEVAEKEGVSINQLVNSAVAEKMAALLTEEYLSDRGKRGSRARFAAALAKVPKGEAEPADRLEGGPSRMRRLTRR
jgi:predicted transcriptional regulator